MNVTLLCIFFFKVIPIIFQAIQNLHGEQWACAKTQYNSTLAHLILYTLWYTINVFR